MIEIVNKEMCCGCTACAEACPIKAINMIADEEGFLYPRIDKEKCVECGICNKVCPCNEKNGTVGIREKEYKNQQHNDIVPDNTNIEKMPSTFVARDRRKDVLSIGTSGSVFTSIMEDILKRKGVVYGVVLDENNIVRHVRVDSKDAPNLRKIPCSKYVRSDIEGIYSKVKEDLELGIIVCFSGVPCQVAGLKSYLRKEYENLYTIDVICHGNPSPLLWKKFVLYLENKYKSKIVDVKFRNKTYGYHSGTMKVTFENGKVYLGSARTNYFLRAFFSDLCSRPSCYNCNFKKIQHVSDITLYDSWHAAELANLEDDDNGYTNVIIQSKKGEQLFSQLDSLESHLVNTMQAVELDGIMVRNSVKWNSNREKFFIDIETEDFKKHCDKFMKISLKDYFIEKMKRVYYFRKFNG